MRRASASADSLTFVEREPKKTGKPRSFSSARDFGAQTSEAQLRAAEDISNEVLNALNGLPLRWKIC